MLLARAKVMRCIGFFLFFSLLFYFFVVVSYFIPTQYSSESQPPPPGAAVLLHYERLFVFTCTVAFVGKRLLPTPYSNPSSLVFPACAGSVHIKRFK